MKIIIQLSDAEGSLIPGAIVVIRHPRPGGQPFVGRSAPANARGVTEFDFPAQTVAQIDFTQTGFIIEVDGEAHEAALIGVPKAREADVRIRVRAQKLILRDAKPPGPQPTQNVIKVVVTVRDEAGNPLGAGRAVLQMDGKTIADRPLDETGRARFELRQSQLDALDDPNFSLLAETAAGRFRSVRFGGISQDGTSALASWVMAAIEVKPPQPEPAGPGDVTDPPKPPVARGGDRGLPSRRVVGRVFDQVNVPIPAAKVTATHIEVGSELALGSASTDAQGRYVIGYDPQALIKAGSVNLVVRVVSADGKVLAASSVIAEPRLEEVVDFALGQGAWRAPSLYETLGFGLLEHLNGADATKLTAAEVEVIAARSGLDPATLSIFLSAWRLAMAVGLKPTQRMAGAPFFAWLMADLGDTLEDLAVVADAKLKATMRQAEERNWIPDLAEEAIVTALRKAATAARGSDLNVIQELLRLAGQDAKRAPAVAEVLAKEETEAARWKGIANVVGESPAKVLRDIVGVWTVLRQNLPLTTFVVERGVKKPMELVAISESDLVAGLTKVGSPPPGAEGKTAQEQYASYAALLARGIEARFPYETFLAQLKSTGGKGQKLAAQLATKPTVRFDRPAKDEAPEIADARGLYQVSPAFRRANTTSVLLDGGIERAAQIVAMGGPRFRAGFADALNGVANADAVFDRAAGRGGAIAATDVAVATSGKPPEGASAKTLTGQLFGDLTQSGCSHCRSMLSPGAYLVDLFSFVQLAFDQTSGHNGRTSIAERRPDLEQTHVTCENTDTVLPYIDLVLEVLEDQTARWQGAARQTTLNVNALKVWPEHVNLPAYKVIADRGFPWNLPFVRSFAATRALTDLADVPLHKLRAMCAAGPISVGAARLGLARPAHLTSADDEGGIAKAYGFADFATLKKRMTGLTQMAQHLQIGAEDLLALLNTDFVCSGEALPFAEDGTVLWAKLGSRKLDRLQILGRLWRLTGLDLEALNAMLDICGLPKADDRGDWLAAMAACLDLGDTTQAAMPELARLMALPRRQRMSGFASLLRLTEDEMLVFHRLGAFDPGSIASIQNFSKDLSGLTDAGLSAGDVLALLTPAAEGVPYASDIGGLAISALMSDLPVPLPDYGQPGALTALTETVSESLSSSLSVDAATIAEHLAHDDHTALLLLLDNGANMTGESLARYWKGWAVMQATGLSAADAEILRDATLGLADPFNLPVMSTSTSTSTPVTVAQLADLCAHQALNAADFTEGQSLFACLAALDPTISNAATVFASATGWPEADIAFALGPDGLNAANRAAFLQRQLVVNLGEINSAATKLKSGVDQIFALAQADDAERARDTVGASFDPAAWPDKAAEAMALVREAARDGFAGHLLATRGDFRTVMNLYDALLIDTEMSACYQTSRIKQASASVQQFIARIQLGLEGELTFSASQSAEWAWRRNYRVWEANRKVFLYPENWIEPELRDNKTALYDKLEAALLQGDVRDETAELALMDYARGLHAIASLEMVGLLEDTEIGTTYVFARSRETPHKYYWCDRRPNGLWSGWREVEVEIEGDHILPVIYNRRVFLFWANISDHVDTAHPDYIEAMAMAEAETEDAKSRLNNALRTIDDLQTKLAEAEGKIEKNDDPFGIYAIMATVYIEAIEVSGGTVSDMQSVLAGLLIEIAEMKEQFSYLDITLTWAQFHRLTGWSSPRRSRGSIVTILADSGIHWNKRDHTFLRRYVDGDTLSIDVVSDRTSNSTIGDLYNADCYVYGRFTLDIVNDALEVTQQTEGDTVFMPAIASGFVRRAQGFAALAPQTLTVVNDGAQDGTTLLQSTANVLDSRVVPASRGYDYPGTSALLFSKDRRSYLIEPELTGRLPNLPPLQMPTLRAPSQSTKGKGTVRAVPQSAGYTRPPAKGKGSVRPSGERTIATQSHFVDAVTPASKPVGEMPAVLSPRMALDSAWRFTDLHHPFTDIVITALYRGGVNALYQPDAATGDVVDVSLNRQARKTTYFDGFFDPAPVVKKAFPIDDFTFDRREPYAIYNWELFYHAPFTVACHLSQNRNFESAQSWFHFIFNPIEKDGPRNASAWRFGPFRDVHQLIQQGSYSELAELDAAALDAQVDEWLANPFNPHAVARMRSLAYMRATFMAYLDNLIDWGDDLFSRDTMETINEATQLYVLAAELLGMRPVTLPELPPSRVQTVADMLDGKHGVQVGTPSAGGKPPVTAFFEMFGEMCIPPNEKLLTYWDRIADRLFKIRHCMNIDGVVRQLPLFQPPIDPALLVRAAAAGVSISAALSAMSAPRPPYRFTFMVAKAIEFTNEVKSLGGALLSALEKKDAEALNQLRSDHELAMHKRVLAIRKDRVKEAETALAGSTDAVVSADHTRAYYENLVQQGQIASEEKEEHSLKQAQRWGNAAQVLSAVSGVLYAIPQTGVTGPMPEINIGGVNYGGLTKALADGAAFVSDQHAYDARNHGRNAGNYRRMAEWRMRLLTATRDLERAEKEQIANELRLAMAQKELSDQEQQIANSQVASDFLTSKFTATQLYTWMVGELSRLHYQAYQLAVDLARQAEACFVDERNVSAPGYIRFGHWDSLKKGLLAGEKLGLDLRQMEAAYLNANARKPEMRKSVSLARLNPAALLDLRQGRTASFTLPEFIFDLDAPGQFRRRIKSVAMSVAALAGPQVSMSCELKLKRSFIRDRAELGDDETLLRPRTGVETITTSAAQNDAGLFQVDFRDERYLPFEGAGVISEWELRLPDIGIAQFDYGSITDVVLQVSYTAEPASEAFRTTIEQLRRAEGGAAIDAFGNDLRPMQIVSLRYDFPITWAQLRTGAATEATLDLSPERFPYLFTGRRIQLIEAVLVAPDGSEERVALNDSPAGLITVPLPASTLGKITADATDITVLISYRVT